MYGYEGEKGWGGKNWETGTDTYTLLILCIKWTTDGNMLCSTGTHLMCCGDLNEGSPKGRGYRYVYGGFIFWCSGG